MDRFWTWTERGRQSLARLMESADPLRAGLILGTVIAAAGAFSALLLLTPGRLAPEAGPQSELASAEAIPDSRLPRPRPDEPVVTGSIQAAEPERDETPAPTLVGMASSRRFDDLRTKAILIASSWSECDQVENSELFELAGGVPDQIMIRIHCANGTRFVLGEADIAANPIVTASAPKPPLVAAEPWTPPPPNDSEVVSACEHKVRQGLPFPASLSRAFGTTGVARMPSGDAIVTFDFDALNGFGFPLLMRVQCVFENREIARLELSPR